MIVSHKYKFIFMRTRKTASTSIEIALSKFCGDRDIITPLVPKDEKLRKDLGSRGAQNYIGLPFFRYNKHMSALKARIFLGKRIWNNYYKFCFERNPWDKAISLYYHETQEPRPTIYDFLRKVNIKLLSNWHIYTIFGKDVMDMIFPYEDLNNSLSNIEFFFDLPTDLILPKTKDGYRDDHRSYQEIMTIKERELIAKRCHKEIKMLYERDVQNC